MSWIPHAVECSGPRRCCTTSACRSGTTTTTCTPSYIVQNSLLPGYTPREKVLIALMTRYHRNRGTPKVGEVRVAAGGGDDRALSVLSAMLRICEYLERGRRQTVRDVRCHLDKEQGWVQIEALCDGDATMEVWDARGTWVCWRRAWGSRWRLSRGCGTSAEV